MTSFKDFSGGARRKECYQQVVKLIKERTGENPPDSLPNDLQV
jgi:hypothetical protein